MSHWSVRPLSCLLLIGIFAATCGMSGGQELKSPAMPQSAPSTIASPAGPVPQKVVDPGTPSNDPLNRPLGVERAGRPAKHSSSPSPSPPGMALTTIVGGLAVCIGAFLLFVWATRRNVPPATGPLPSEVIESLGKMALQGRQQLQLIRLGKKLVLLNVTATSAETVTEIDDPDEVLRLTGLCQQAKPNSVTATFREVLGQSPEGKGYFAAMRKAELQPAGAASRRVRIAHEEFDD